MHGIHPRLSGNSGLTTPSSENKTELGQKSFITERTINLYPALYTTFMVNFYF